MKSRFFTSFRMTAAGITATLLLVSGIAFATITLDTTQVQKYQLGGTTVETDDTASAVSADTNFVAKTITSRIGFGTSTSGFVAGARAHSVTVTINAQTGEVSVSDGRQNLQLSSAQQAAVQSFITGFQDQLEKAVVSWGIISGTQVPN